MSWYRKLITKDNFFSLLGSKERPWLGDYLSMYSSQWQGYVTDPALMMVPVDDHMVHRGDGVFDVMRCIHGRVYQMEAHLNRLERSARAIALDLPPEYDDVREIIKSLILAGGEKECLVRVFLSRGPGSFSANPFDSPASQMYVIVLLDRTNPQGPLSRAAGLFASCFRCAAEPAAGPQKSKGMP